MLTLDDSRRLQAGDQVTLKELRGVSFIVRGVFRSPGSSLESVILVDRTFLEYAIRDVGAVTMFLVLVDGPEHVEAASFQIDELFANAQTQTKSGPEKAFIAGSIEDFKDLVQFAQVVAYLALVLVLAAVANSVSMSVRDRLREMAIMKTLGFRRGRVVRLILAESMLVSVAAAALGCGAAAVVLYTGRFSISVEGYTIAPHLSLEVCGLAILAGAVLGFAGSYLPARRGAGLPVVTALREVD
ncbi:MAG: ABC transporter permease [Gemmataceae bacterium]